MTTSADGLSSRTRNRVFAVEVEERPYRAYEEIGAQASRALVDPARRLVVRGKRVLDFGSGAGRTLRHFMSEAETAELWGTDIDAPEHRAASGACARRSTRGAACPGPVGPGARPFDLAWAISVFTHLTENSTPWLLELHRLLKPGRMLIATYMGRWNSMFFAGEPWEEDRVGRNVLQHNRAWDLGGPAVLMSDWWVRAHWGRAFEILEIAPEIHNMSWAVMRKRDVELTTDDVDTPDDDPRELVALRHNLRQLQREVEQLTEGESQQRALLAQLEQRNEHERVVRELAMRDLRRGYEDSTSWKLTRPVRAGARAVRSIRARLKAPRRSAAPRG